MGNRKLVYRLHALTRMAQRGFAPSEVSAAIAAGTIIEQYPDDVPYPSFLLLSWVGDRPVHIVAAMNDVDQETIIITVYEPDAKNWAGGFKRRIL